MPQPDAEIMRLEARQLPSAFLTRHVIGRQIVARSEARTENALPAPITLSQTEPTQNWPMPAIPDRFFPLED